MGAPLGMLGLNVSMAGLEFVEAVQRFESLDYHELWLPENLGREPFAACGYLLAKTTTLRVSSGIANIYVRDADAAAQGRQTLGELSGGRFSLGLGVSHPSFIEPRGHEWKPPVEKMRAYLNRIKFELPAYHRTWAAAGYSEKDWSGGGSNRLIDGLCAWGSPDRIRDQLREFETAGATHIVLVGLNSKEVLDGSSDDLDRWNWDLLEALAPTIPNP